MAMRKINAFLSKNCFSSFVHVTFMTSPIYCYADSTV